MRRNFSWIKIHKAEVILVLVALLARLILFGISFHAEGSNLISTIHGDDGYFEISRNISQGHGFTGESYPPYLPNPLRPPAYPLFLALPLYLTGSYWVVMIVQMLVGSLIPLLGMMVSRRILESRRMSFGVGYALALEPYSMLLSFIFYTETVFTTLFLLFLILFFRYLKTPSLWWSACTGFMLAMATLVKPTVQYLPILLPLGLVWYWRDRLSRKLFGHLAVFLLVFATATTPWLVRNYYAFGVAGMSAQPSFNLMVYLVPSVRSLDKGTDFATELKQWIAEEHNLDTNTITLATSRMFRDRAVAELKKYPVGLMKSAGITLVTFFTHDGMATVLQHAGIEPAVAIKGPVFLVALKDPAAFVRLLHAVVVSPAILILTARVAWILSALFFFGGIFIFFRHRGFAIPAVTSVLLIFYFAFTTMINGLGVNARFRIPVNALILTFAVYALARFGKRLMNFMSLIHA